MYIHVYIYIFFCMRRLGPSVPLAGACLRQPPVWFVSLVFASKYLYNTKRIKNIVNVNNEFCALIYTCKFIQHNLSAIERTTIKYSSIQIHTISRTRWSLIIYKPTLIFFKSPIKKDQNNDSQTIWMLFRLYFWKTLNVCNES